MRYYPKEIDYCDFEELCPVSERACASEAVWLSQSMLMGTPEDMADISRAIQKIQANVSQLF